MSRTSRREESKPEPLVGPDGGTPTAPMVLSGVVKTSRGYAVALATLRADGTVERVELKGSQAFKQYVAAQHKNIVLAEALKA